MIFFFSPFRKATIFRRQNQNVNHFFLGTSNPQRQQGMHSSSSTFGSLQLHSDMESCAGHLQNQTYSHSKAGKRGRRVVMEQLGFATAFPVATNSKTQQRLHCKGQAQFYRKGEGKCHLPPAQTNCATGQKSQNGCTWQEGCKARTCPTSSPFWILLLELMIILCPLSKVTTSATQLGAHEWLMYLQRKSGTYETF